MVDFKTVKEGQCFLYEKSIFVVCEYNDYQGCYPVVCIATKNHEKYQVGDVLGFFDDTKIKIVPLEKIEKFIPND